MKFYKWPAQIYIYGILTFFMIPSTTSAAEIKWTGFASLYARDSLSEDVRDNSADPNGIATSNDSKFGLNLRADIDENWSAIGQFVISQKSYLPSNDSPNWGGEFDWFFLSYRNTDYGFEVKAGRQLFPSNLIAEYVDVGLTYPWRRLPQQFSAISQFKSFEGVSVSRKSEVAGMYVETRLFGGNSKSNLQPNTATALQINGIVGGLISAEGDGWKVQATYTEMNITHSTTIYTPSLTFVEGEIPKVRIWIAGGKYDRGGFVTYAEYANSQAADTSVAKIDGFYGLVGHHFGRFLPYYTYAKADWVIAAFADGEEVSHNYGLNYQVNPSIIIKTEFIRQFDKRGAVFLSKANSWAESVSVGVNAVF